MNELPTLILTVGLPRSGKSTEVTQYLKDVRRGWVDKSPAVVCPDNIRKAIGCYPFDPQMEVKVWATVHAMVEALFLSGHDEVILDATNISRPRRQGWADPEWNLEYWIFPTSADICKARAIESGQEYLLPVIDRMQAAADWEAEIETPECPPYLIVGA